MATSIINTLSTLTAISALSMGLVACGNAEVTELSPEAGAQAVEQAPAELSLTGAPSFMVPPHARTSTESAARMTNGYHYAFGQLDETTSYGLYTYLDVAFQYVSTSIWGANGDSISQSVDVGSDGSQWIQNGFYEYDMVKNISSGEYTTTSIDANHRSTLYLTNFQSSAEESSYLSIIDKSDTPVLPDTEYFSHWTPASSYSRQTENRADGSAAICESVYNNGTTDAQGAYRYTSQQACDDTRTENHKPDFAYDSEMSWNPVTGEYSSSGRVICYDANDAERTLLFTNLDGWEDEGGNLISGPSAVCVFQGIQMY